MIIIHDSKGITKIEGKDFKNWDEVSDGISSIELGTFANELITLPKCKEYFYSVEARTSISVGQGAGDVGKPVVTAKIIGGILDNGQALYIRVDTRGHIQMKLLNKEELGFKSSVYKNGRQQINRQN